VEAIGTLVTLQGRQYILGFCRDITERKQAEQALLLTQRTESIGVLAGGIAHDFNNLLTAIMGQTGMALDQMEPEAPGRDNLEKALRASEKAAILTKQMLAYSGRGQFAIQPVPINHLIQENLRFLEAAMPKQVRFVLDLEDGLPNVTADPGQLQQVVMNLVINGAEAIGEAPGTITIRTRALCPGTDGFGPWPLGAQDLAEGDYVGLEIADTGCGMPRDVLARVFDPFYTTKPKGHGLGLSAVQGILRGHRGGLGVESKVGAGTTFRILLPAGGLDEAMAPPAEAGAAAGAGRAVLVVDDEEYLLEVVSDSLAVTGHTCLLARSGEEGLDLFRLHGSAVDLVLLDLSMPGIGGVETFKRLRALDPGLPIILSSGYAREEAMAQLGDLTADGFLQKPYVARDLARIVATVPLRKAPR
jgi:nitrogen-specific signal transduction histidine kinase/ActR/RegA family two-component response regulator